ncbi:MAG: hypothetical protein IAF94_20405 [Pirellulaceae bacterium]|nr:hypothetical protein [Pirellulaceae bacterium]
MSQPEPSGIDIIINADGTKTVSYFGQPRPKELSEDELPAWINWAVHRRDRLAAASKAEAEQSAADQ